MAETITNDTGLTQVYPDIQRFPGGPTLELAPGESFTPSDESAAAGTSLPAPAAQSAADGPAGQTTPAVAAAVPAPEPAPAAPETPAQ